MSLSKCSSFRFIGEEHHNLKSKTGVRYCTSFMIRRFLSQAPFVSTSGTLLRNDKGRCKMERNWAATRQPGN